MSSLSVTDPCLSRAGDLVVKYLPSKPTLWLKPPGSLKRQGPESRFWHPWFPEHQRLQTGGWVQSGAPTAQWDQVVLFGSKQKEETRRLIELGRTLTKADGKLYFVIPNDYGSKSYQKDLEKEQALIEVEVGRKSRLYILRPSDGELSGEFADYQVNSAKMMSTPGLFSWDKADRGSKALEQILANEKLTGPVADLGAGWGFLSKAIPESLPLHVMEADARGIEACKRNLQDRSVNYHWADVTDPQSLSKDLFHSFRTVVTNPPFHTNKRADPVLGGAFVAMSKKLLKRRGCLYLVGNVHLPYRKIMGAFFERVEELAKLDGFSILKGSD